MGESLGGAAPMTRARQFTHQRLEAFRRSLELAGLTHEICESLPRGYAELRGQLFRSGCAVTLLVAEGANRRTKGQKRQRFVEAQGECGEACATVELLEVLGVVTRQTRERYDGLANHVSALISGLVKKHS